MKQSFQLLAQRAPWWGPPTEKKQRSAWPSSIMFPRGPIIPPGNLSRTLQRGTAAPLQVKFRRIELRNSSL
jgi:hypothetical protein